MTGLSPLVSNQSQPQQVHPGDHQGVCVLSPSQIAEHNQEIALHTPARTTHLPPASHLQDNIKSDTDWSGSQISSGCCRPLRSPYSRLFPSHSYYRLLFSNMMGVCFHSFCIFCIFMGKLSPFYLVLSQAGATQRRGIPPLGPAVHGSRHQGPEQQVLFLCLDPGGP